MWEVIRGCYEIFVMSKEIGAMAESLFNLQCGHMEGVRSALNALSARLPPNLGLKTKDENSRRLDYDLKYASATTHPMREAHCQDPIRLN